MTTPPQKPDMNSPHASRGEKIRNAKSTVGVGGSGTSGIGEAPSSRAKKILIWFAIAMIVLFIVMDFIDRANVKKEREQRSQTSGLYLDENVRSSYEFTLLG
jgi:preprotein translocase subunit SecG